MIGIVKGEERRMGRRVIGMVRGEKRRMGWRVIGMDREVRGG